MTSNPEPSFQFSQQVDGQIAVYRPTNRFAVLSLILALLSLITLVVLHPAWWAIPVVGSLLGGIALYQISKSSDSQSGKITATLAILLSLALLCCAVVSRVMRYQQARAEAKLVAATWFESLQTGRFQRAHQLTLDARIRSPETVLLEKHYHDHPNLARNLDLYLERPAVLSIVKWGTDATVEHLETYRQQGTYDRDLIADTYRVTRSSGDKTESVKIRLILVRTRNPKSGKFYWKVKLARPETIK